MTTQTIELSVGTIDYEDTGGDGPVVLLLHGLLMDASLWDGVIEALGAGHRCVAPTLPLGAHRHPLGPAADLSPAGITRLVAELIDRLQLRDVTIVGNDTGGAIVQLLLRDHPAAVSRVVLVSCDAFDNFPPGLTGRFVVLTGKLPPALFGACMQQLRLRPVRRLPIAFGWLTKRGDAATKRWMQPILRQRLIRHDAVRVLRGIASQRQILVEVADDLRDVEQPTLIVWAEHDRVMPPEHGRRLAELLPDARLIEVADSYTLVPLDQPEILAQLLADFVGEHRRSVTAAPSTAT